MPTPRSRHRLRRSFGATRSSSSPSCRTSTTTAKVTYCATVVHQLRAELTACPSPSFSRPTDEQFNVSLSLPLLPRSLERKLILHLPLPPAHPPSTPTGRESLPYRPTAAVNHPSSRPPFAVSHLRSFRTTPRSPTTSTHAPRHLHIPLSYLSIHITPFLLGVCIVTSLLFFAFKLSNSTTPTRSFPCSSTCARVRRRLGKQDSGDRAGKLLVTRARLQTRQQD